MSRLALGGPNGKKKQDEWATFDKGVADKAKIKYISKTKKSVLGAFGTFTTDKGLESINEIKGPTSGAKEGK